jgi:hypothetical protein
VEKDKDAGEEGKCRSADPAVERPGVVTAWSLAASRGVRLRPSSDAGNVAVLPQPGRASIGKEAVSLPITEALRLVRADGAVRPLSYADLTGQTNGTIALRDRIRPLAILKDSWP